MRRMISIHALREEGDPQLRQGQLCRKEFLSTPSARRATHSGGRRGLWLSDFYPRPPRGGRPYQAETRFGRVKFLSTPSARRATIISRRPPVCKDISIHALREEGDLCIPCACWLCPKFLSTPSARRATNRQTHDKAVFGISIHALREEGDNTIASMVFDPNMISIHALREEGDEAEDVVEETPDEFLSTPSARRATRRARQCRCIYKFLSTPSARRATTFRLKIRTRPKYFYPRPPRGGRQQKQRQNLYFLINYTTFCTNLEEP